MWRKFDEYLSAFGHEEELIFQAQSRAKQRVNKYGSTKQQTRFYEDTIAELAREQIGEDLPLFKDPKAELSLQILWLCQKRRGDLSNNLKSLEDALNRIAWTDDRQIVHVNGLFIDGQPEDKTLLRIRAKS